MNAREWLAEGRADAAAVVVLGAPISKASISPSNAWATPPAIRAELSRFPLWDAEHAIDLTTLPIADLGDVQGDRDDADAAAAHARIEEAVRRAGERDAVVVILGGDNSLTRPAAHGLLRDRDDWGLLTLDAHHDCRSLDGGPRNGTPVRELIEAGLPGGRVAQVGIHPYGNRRDHAEWALRQGVHVHPVGAVRDQGMGNVLQSALSELQAAGATSLYVDIDIDVVDRAAAPACPASMPGGLTPADVLDAAHLLGGLPQVRGLDITEVDATADVNSMTVRLAAGVLMAFCSGVAGRLGTHAGA